MAATYDQAFPDPASGSQRPPRSTRPENDPAGIQVTPLLFLDEVQIRFPEIRLGEEAFQVVTISQIGIQSGLTLRTDWPDCFQFATDEHPDFSPYLTIEPPFRQVIVHVRFTPGKAGRIQGFLTVLTPYCTKCISLKGRCRLRLSQTWWFRGLVMVLITGLCIAGYLERNRLMTWASGKEAIVSETGDETAAGRPSPSELTRKNVALRYEMSRKKPPLPKANRSRKGKKTKK
ncbi:hypothetical protein [Larkinella soli]|uniref:hypothetical protein n=1 Tax=Larkinella soli TaxID=1770527 RepID=UPI000FFBD1D7|nr:hypothetical protein [Larkinella soli]